MEGIVLKIYPVREANERVLLATTEGVLSVFSFGTQKSVKKGRLFTLLLADFKLDFKRGSWTIIEVNSPTLFEHLTQNITKFYTANTLAEIALKGLEDNTFSLLKEALLTLDTAPASAALPLLIQFLWRWILLSGEGGDLERCSLCERALRETVLYGTLEDGLLCASCATSHADWNLFSLNAGMRRYLLVTENLTLSETLKRRLDKKSERQLVIYLCQKIENILKWKLKSWEFTESLLLASNS